MRKTGILLLFAVALILLSIFLRTKNDHVKFDTVVWKTAELNSENNLSLRWDMINDLRSRYKIVGVKKNEIIELLGKPEQESDSEFRHQLDYSKKGINTGTLVLTFDDKNIVTKLKVWQG